MVGKWLDVERWGHCAAFKAIYHIFMTRFLVSRNNISRSVVSLCFLLFQRDLREEGRNCEFNGKLCYMFKMVDIIIIRY